LYVDNINIHRSTTQLHRKGEEPAVKGAYIMKMITTPTHLRAAQ
jgi:hypothetical protein